MSQQFSTNSASRVDDRVVTLIAVVFAAWLLWLPVTLAAVVADWPLQGLAVKITLYPVAAVLICVALYPLVLLASLVVGFVIPILSLMFPFNLRRR